MERHPVLELLPDPGENVGAWARLSPLVGANVVSRVRPEGVVLLEHPTERMAAGGALPILVLGGAGEGRTLALTTDTAWRWGITTGGATGDASAYERFWDRAIRWLSRDPALVAASITTDRERFGPAARARVEGHLRDPRYAPYAERPVALRLLDTDGHEVSVSQGRTDREGHVEAGLDLPSRPGAYRVEARIDGLDEAVATEWLVVEAGGDELADPRGAPELLSGLAEATGGSFYPSPDDAPALDAFDTTRTRSLGTAERAPFASGWAFAGLVLLFVGEWVLRRRWGRR
jgi:hypothetical protein